MSLPVYDTKGEQVSELQLPGTFSYPVNIRLIRKAFWLLLSHSRQPKGTDPFAGERTSAQSWNTGRGAARPARVKGERSQRSGQAAGVGGVVKGRLAIPPRSEKVVRLSINSKERKVAFASALGAISSTELVRARGHMLPDGFRVPVVADDSLQSVSRATELRVFLEKLGLLDDVRRAANRRRRGGRASWRGRSKKVGRGPLIIVSKDEGISKAAGNYPGVEVVTARDVSLLHLAPGGVPGRFCIFTKSALEELQKRLGV
jgi:large subunit ribosomal protein L4e